MNTKFCKIHVYRNYMYPSLAKSVACFAHEHKSRGFGPRQNVFAFVLLETCL